jgi:Rod binding domain-containing protein
MDSKHSLQLAKMKNSAQETRDYAFKMEAVKKNLMPPVDKEKKLRESCEGFESIFIQKMWEQMRATIPEGGFLKGREEKFWQSMYDQELAKTMAGAGGIGLADMMYEQLSHNLRSASKHTADATGGRSPGFTADLAPAPLLNPAAPPRTQTAADFPEATPRQQKPAALAG